MYIHGDCIGRKFYADFWVEVVNGFNKADAADLEQVVYVFIAASETFDDA